MNMEAYKVAIRLSLINNVSSALFAMGSHFRRLNQDVATGQKGLDKYNEQVLRLKKSMAEVKAMGLIGGGLAAVGFGGLSMMNGPLKAAMEYEQAHTRFKTLNLGAVVDRQADQFARSTKVFGASSKDLMETLRESVGMFDSLKTAMDVAPKLAELNAANSTLFGGKIGKLDENAIKSVMRFNDMRGLTDNKEDFMRGLDLTQRMVTGSGGSLKFSDLEQMAKRGGAAFKGLSDDGVMMLATIAQEQGGSSTGTALMSLYQNLIAGRTPKKTMAALAEAGLGELTQVKSGLVGGKTSTSVALKNIKDEEMLRLNPGAWLMKYGTEAAKKSGATTDSQVIAFMNNLVSNRVASNMAATFTTQQMQAMRDFKLVKNAKGVDGTIEANRLTLAGKLADMQAKWNDTLNNLGTTILPLAIEAAKGMTSALEGFNRFARENTNTVKGLTYAFVGLSTAMAIGGTLMLATAAFKGLSLAAGMAGGVGGIPLLGAAIGALASPLGIAALALGAITKAAGLFMAAYAGWQAGGWVKEKIDEHIQGKTRDKDATLGTWLYDMIHGDDTSAPNRHAPFQFGPQSRYGKENPNGYYARRRAQGMPTVAGASSQMINNTIVMPNGEVLAKVVTKQQEKALSRPQSGTSGFDPTMSLSRVGGGSGF